MSDLSLNFARKWRSKDFGSIIGQDLSLRILKNSLYKGHFFPVYLFAGQRGCGKTTTARVFATAINCKNLVSFQQSPKEQAIPCDQCDSCLAMRAHNHPDFIEIDAASYTGVDNVRQIIEACSLAPSLGTKKIYLIDEAHMLSKAAFNAFLKILEEPPLSVVFILATTDPEKIIETVRSRCFKLFFTAVQSDELEKHLSMICAAENIPHQENALRLIVQESEGSVRDAINLLEQARFAAPTLTKEVVLRVLGRITDEQMVELCGCLLYGDARTLLTFMQKNALDGYNVDVLYEALAQIIRAAIWMKYDVALQESREKPGLRELIKKTTVERLCALQEILCEHELLLSKTTKKHLLFEMMLLKMVPASEEHNTHGPDGQPSAAPRSVAPRTAVPRSVVPRTTAPRTAVSGEDVQEKKIVSPSPTVIQKVVHHDDKHDDTHTEQPSRWHEFLGAVDTLNDPWLKSVFAQAKFGSYSPESGVLVSFAEQFSFYKEMVQEKQGQWLPLLKKVFGEPAFLVSEFIEIQTAPEAAQEKTSDAAAGAHTSTMQRPPVRPMTPTQKQKVRTVDMSDGKWQKTDLVMKYFPGTITELIEGAP